MADQFETLLQDTLEAQAELFPDLAERTHPARPATQPRRSSVRRSGPLVALAAGAVVLLGLGGSMWLIRQALPSLESGSVFTPEDGGVPTEWSLSDFAPGDWTTNAIATGTNGAVLIGDSTEGNRTKVWHSSDTAEWSEVDGFEGGVLIRGLTGGSFGFLGSGLRLPGTTTPTTTAGQVLTDRPVATVWYSPDGTAWTESALPLPPAEQRIGEQVEYYVRAVAGTGRVLVAAGDEIEDATIEIEGEQVNASRPLVWRSEDGDNWELAADPGWTGATSAGSIAASGDVVALVVGFGGDDPQSTIWTSENGEDWRQVHRFDQGVWVGQLAGSAEGFIATINDGTVWFSSDGSAWTPSFTPPADLRVGSVSGGDAGFIMTLGPSDLDPFESSASEYSSLIYTSPDGQTWEPIAEESTFGPGFLGTNTAYSDEDVLVVGNRSTNGRIIYGTYVSELWIGTSQD